MDLLEREPQLAALAEYAADALATPPQPAQGRLVLVAGEAGGGKSSLLEAFEDTLPGVRWAWGGCDGGFTPSPLGPLVEVAEQLGGTIADAVRAGRPRADLFAALLQALADPTQATVVVLEDLHWADEATLDLVRYLGRRLRRQRGLVLRRTATSSSSPPTRCGSVWVASPPSAPPGESTSPRSRVGRRSDGGGQRPRRCHRPRADRWQPLLRDRGAPLGRRRAAGLGPGRGARAGGSLGHGARTALQSAAVVGGRFDPDLLDARSRTPTPPTWTPWSAPDSSSATGASSGSATS